MRVIFNLTEIRFFDNLNLLFGNSLELCNSWNLTYIQLPSACLQVWEILEVNPKELRYV